MMRRFFPSTVRTYGVLAFLFALGSVGVPGEAEAQPSAPGPAQAVSDGPSAEWKQNVGKQLGRLLRSPDPDRRATAMQLIIQLSAKHGTTLDLSPCAPLLLRQARNEAEEKTQILALTALYEIRSEQALQKLAEHARDFSSERVRQHALRVLVLAQSAQAQS